MFIIVGWRDSSGDKRTGCSSRGPEFSTHMMVYNFGSKKSDAFLCSGGSSMHVGHISYINYIHVHIK